MYDAFLPWALDVAKKLGLVGVVFFTQSCTVNNIYYHVHQGMLKLPLSELKVVVPRLFPLQAYDLPSFVYLYDSYPVFFDLVVNSSPILRRSIKCLSSLSLNSQVVDWMVKICPLRTFGPTLPSAYLDKRLGDDKDYGLNMLKPVAGACMEWLDSKPAGSVVYASYGSFVELEPEHMEEVAWGLRRSNAYFLMVVKESEQAKLPQNFKRQWKRAWWCHGVPSWRF
ncbi:hypothetical protein PVL29_009381 [Vitis rotundifolia]|uniref:Uncharacterized protein n=1 Tax=Vitis rotundifolia TaxID=103349 RepID=A0AA39A086_VITRO|nr:hypothetical protein PVL29_009381 [Vitis rotundifolia]